MTYKTHVLFAMTSSVPIVEYSYGLMSLNAGIFLMATAVGALAPDLDEEGSYLSRKIPIFPMVFKLFGVTHRGITHRLISVFMLLGFFLLLGIAEPVFANQTEMFYGFTFGWLMHLFGDMLTKGGINQFFYPFSKKKGVLLPRSLRFYTGSIKEKMVLLFISAVLVAEIVLFTKAIDA